MSNAELLTKAKEFIEFCSENHSDSLENAVEHQRSLFELSEEDSVTAYAILAILAAAGADYSTALADLSMVWNSIAEFRHFDLMQE